MPLARNAPLSIGSVFQGGYEILSELGAGSFGQVYKARQLSTGQEVAIKVLRFRQGDTGAEITNQIERFRREMRLCAELSHPNIVRLIDSGESDDGILYAVFEFVPGSTLKAILAAEGKLSVREALHLMTQVLDALSCAHARGVVHRDLKPENIMVTKTGARRNALVLDLGLGGFAEEVRSREQPRLTATQEMMGTPCYAAPEQLRGELPTTRSDLYSWGLIFLECLTGELAVSGGSGQEVILKQLGPAPIPIPAQLRRRPLGRLLETVTAKAVEKRDVTIEGLLRALDQAAVRELSVAQDASRSAALPEGERRQLTVASCRLTVSSPPGDELDVEELDEVLHAQYAMFAEQAARVGGQVAGVVGDRVLLVFGYPQAREDDAQRAARTALQIAAAVARNSARLESERGLQLQIRIGMHTGLVVVRELRQAVDRDLYDVVGRTPQIAAALEGLAAPGEVLVSLDTQRLLRHAFLTEPVEAQLPGQVAARRPVFRLTGERRPAAAGLETISTSTEPPLVGRDDQLKQLLQCWSQTQMGNSGAVLIRGEPGIGKSRLLRELHRRVPPDSWLECRCIEENQHTPLRPIVDFLLAANEPVDALLERYGLDVDETYPLFAALLSLPLGQRYAPLQLSLERQKELTLNAILSLFLKMSDARPLVLAIEDVHWSDPTTLDLIALLVQEVHTAQVVDAEHAPRLAVLLTARPEFTPPWPMDEQLLLQLSRLSREGVEQMITSGLAKATALPPAILEQVVRRSDGIPLFVEEVTRMLLESGAFAEPTGRLTPEIPTSLRDLLAARLDGLSSSSRETAQLAAVLGREFRYEVLSAIARKDEPSLRADVDELVTSGLVYHRRSVRPESYVFKHALVCDAAYESLVRSRRRVVHERVANTLCQRFPDVEQNRPEMVALHFENGGEPMAAAAYWHRAGDRAIKRAAYVEATRLLERGLALLGKVPPSAARTGQEIDLLTTLGTALFLTKGFAAEEVERTFARASELCEQAGEDVSLKVLNGIWSVSINRGDRARTIELVPRFQRLAERADDPVNCIAGHATLGVYAFDTGDFAGAREHFARGRKLYGSEAFQGFARQYGFDGGLFVYAYDMLAAWALGYAEQGEAICAELQRIAESSRNPHSIAIALGYGEALAYNLGDTAVALERSDRLMALSTEQHLYAWMAAASCGRGGALQQSGDTDAAIALLQQGVMLYRSIGLMSAYSYRLTYLAAAYRDARQVDAGLAAVDEGLSLCATNVQCFHQPELLRLKGELLLLREDVGGAETHFREAIEHARRQQAKAYELRAATDLSRLLRAQGKGDAAQTCLEGIYGWFTEGFDTQDLQTAKALLAELS